MYLKCFIFLITSIITYSHMAYINVIINAYFIITFIATKLINQLIYFEVVYFDHLLVDINISYLMNISSLILYPIILMSYSFSF